MFYQLWSVLGADHGNRTKDFVPVVVGHLQLSTACQCTWRLTIVYFTNLYTIHELYSKLLKLFFNVWYCKLSEGVLMCVIGALDNHGVMEFTYNVIVIITEIW